MSLIDIKKVQEEAQAEIRKEREEKAKGQIKAKMKQVEQAEIIVMNLKRELDDLIATIGEGNE